MKSFPKLSQHAGIIQRAPCGHCQLRFLSKRSSCHPNSLPGFHSALPFQTSRRNASTKLRKSIDELPQGLQAPLEPFIEKEASKYSPTIDEVLQNQRRFPKCVLLTRLGQFYEVQSTFALTEHSCISIRLRKLLLYLILNWLLNKPKMGRLAWRDFPSFN